MQRLRSLFDRNLTDPAPFADELPSLLDDWAKAGIRPIIGEPWAQQRLSPLTMPPMPGFTEINKADKPREGDGNYLSRNGGHYGVDFKAPAGTQVHAAGDGKVLDTNRIGDYGNQVVIDHGNGLCTQSAHLGSVAVKRGDRVKAGDVIGTVGEPGTRAAGNVPKMGDAHLHYEVRTGNCLPRKNRGEILNPFHYLPIKMW